MLEGHGAAHMWMSNMCTPASMGPESWDWSLSYLSTYSLLPLLLFHIGFLQQLRITLCFNIKLKLENSQEKASNWTSLGHEAGFEPKQRGSRDYTLSYLALWPL